MIEQERYAQAKKITLIGALINAILGLLKVMGGLLTHSHALVADGIHSFSDLLSDMMVLFASKYGSLDADETHPYGHQRIETAATLLLSLLLIFAGFGIAWGAINELIQGTYTKPSWFAIPVIFISILANEVSFRYTLSVGQRINSPLILTNAWHHRSDAASSVVVLIGLIGSILNFIYLDALAASIVGFIIVKMGVDYGWFSVKELIDTAVGPELFKEMEAVIFDVDGVKKIHQLRSRFMGSTILIDVHILVSPKISVSEGHYIAQQVHQALMKRIENVKDVVVHVDPEDDELFCPSLHLPSRKVIDEQLFHEMRLDFPQILFWNLHYLDGKISIDMICSEDFTQWEELQSRIAQVLQLQPDIKTFRLFRLQNIMVNKE